MIRSEDPSEPRPTEPACANASHAGAGHRELSRRRFLQSAAVAGASVAVPGAAYAATDASAGPQAIDSRAKEEGASMNGPSMNALNPVVPNFSVSGQAEVNSMVSKALDHGINFFDNAWEYHKGMSEERVGIALKGKRDKAIVMTKVCTHGRKKDLAMRMLEESLVRLQTDHLDVWQVHEVIYYNDPELAYEPDGVLEALTAAKQQGKVRFVGFTGHKNPSIHLDMLNRGFAFDTVQMPINPFDPGFRSFESDVLPVAVQRGMAVFSMKSMGGSGEMIVQGALSPTEALSYAMSVPGISTTISGMDSMAVLDQNLQILAGFRPLNEQEMSALRQHGRQFRDGRYELFKSTVKYDGDVGREQHHFPLAADLPA
jgi:aryl-alcohol dehydrogenase-like predicted oxidoreductase